MTVERVLLRCDGGARGNPGPAAIGAVLLDGSREPPTVVREISERIGNATNNVAEYRALLAGLEAARDLGARRVRVQSDSELLVRQLQGRYRVRSPGLRPLYERALGLLAGFEETEVAHLPRACNERADALVNAALDGAPR